MKRISFIILIHISFVLANYVKAQNESTYDLFLKFAKLYNSGDLINAEKCMLSALGLKESIPGVYMVAIYNNLGATGTLLGKYKEALEYYSLAEDQITKKEQFDLSLASIYINKAIIYGYRRSFTQAIEFFEKGIRICLETDNPDEVAIHILSTAYLNIGIIYYRISDYRSALEYLKRSAELKLRYNLSAIAHVYLNIAKTHLKSGDDKKAEEYFIKSINSFNYEFGEDYYRIAELYFDYGQFLESRGREPEALEIFEKALTICLNTYGNKHPLVSLSYKHLGDFFANRNDNNSALVYYQKALIAVVNDFNDPDIFSNPEITSSLYDIRLLDILKSKSLAFENLAVHRRQQEDKIRFMNISFGTIELALQLINKIRNDYMNEESRIYLADNEKETYIHATHISRNIHALTGDPAFLQKTYNIISQAKAAVLRNEITDNELFYSIGIPDTMQKERNDLLIKIAAYNKLVGEEIQKAGPDNKKIEFWKDALFEMKRTEEELEDEINIQFPGYRDLLRKTEPLSLDEIKGKLKKNETLIEYFLSNQWTNGRRKLFIFLVTKKRLSFHETDLDSLFIKDVGIIRKGTVMGQSDPDPLESYIAYTGALFRMYDRLIRPVEDHFTGNRLIIIPDEEIAYLPFGAFLKSYPDPTQINYEGLQYLISGYTFSFAYSSSLVFSKTKDRVRREKVYAFSPDYRGNIESEAENAATLAGAAKEITAIYRRFSGKLYSGEHATVSNFRSVIKHPAILHLAMHSMPDPDNSKYSYLLFDPGSDTTGDGKLYNYEIGISRIRSPMIVLSACNTGTGTLSRGEGIMSLARGFFLAGASSVVKTYWDVNDEASAAVMTRFYHHLSNGVRKDEAMRLAKLDYLKTQSPVYTNPYYWAAYDVLGNTAPIVRKKSTSVLIIIVSLIIITGVCLVYFNRRIIFSARSR